MICNTGRLLGLYLYLSSWGKKKTFWEKKKTFWHVNVDQVKIYMDHMESSACRLREAIGKVNACGMFLCIFVQFCHFSFLLHVLIQKKFMVI